MNPVSLGTLCSQGLRKAPSQVSGGIRLVPLIRDEVRGDLRLGLRGYTEDLTLVNLGGRVGGNSPWLLGYVPHGMIVNWSDSGEPVAAVKTAVAKRGKLREDTFAVRVEHRLVKRKGRTSLRMMPMSAALEGLLALHFRGPDKGWDEYSTRALSRGLDPRFEQTYAGSTLMGLEEALRTFERHPGQCGVMVFVADALASVTVVSHPDDYAAMHRSLLLDGYGELIWQYACRFGEQADHVQAAGPERKPGKVKSFADLRDLATTLRADLGAHYETMGAGLFDREIQGKALYSMAGFRVEQFLTDLTLGAENHIGECIRREDGTVEYLKTFRLSAAQVRRAHLLRSLHEHEWNIEETAKFLGTDWRSLMLRIEKVDLGFLLRPEELARARKL